MEAKQFLTLEGVPPHQALQSARQLASSNGFAQAAADLPRMLDMRGISPSAVLLLVSASFEQLGPALVADCLHHAGESSAAGFALQNVQPQVQEVCRKLLTGLSDQQPSSELFARTWRIVRTTLRAAGLGHVLSAERAQLLELALVGRLPDAQDLAAEQVLDIAPGAGGAAEVSAYFQLCGLALSLARSWEDAADAYRCAFLLAPAGPSRSMAAAGQEDAPSGLTPLQAEALRKWLLCCLIAYGRLSSAPRWIVSGMPMHGSRPETNGLNRAYASLVKASDTDNAADVHNIQAEHESVFNYDGNTPLVAVLVEACLTRRVAKLGDTYSAVTLAQATAALSQGSRRMSENEAKTFLTKAIAQGVLKASFDEASGRLTFASAAGAGAGAAGGSGAASPAVTDADVEALQQEVTDAHELVAAIRAADRSMTVQPVLLRKLMSGKGTTRSIPSMRAERSMLRQPYIGAAGSAMQGQDEAWSAAFRTGGGAGSSIASAVAFGSRGFASSATGHVRVLSEEEEMAWALHQSMASAGGAAGGR